MPEQLFFLLGLSFLTIHELDAIRCKEWRILPLLSRLDDKMGSALFLLAHIPLFLWVFVELTSSTISQSFIKGFDIFMIIHVGLHLLLLRHQRNEFKDALSWFFIAGAGVFGATDLLT